MMAFIEQEAREKVEEIDAKVSVVVPFLGFSASLRNGLLVVFHVSYSCVFPRLRKNLTLRKDVWCRPNVSK